MSIWDCSKIGGSSPDVIWKHYARWISDDGRLKGATEFHPEKKEPKPLRKAK